jgi:CO dehydrogenase/acetyl-CoA synthase beta subunit
LSELFSTCLSQPSAEEDLGEVEGEEEEEEEEDEECASEEENKVSVLKNCFLAMVDTLSKQVLKLSFKMNIQRPVYLRKVIISVSVINSVVLKFVLFSLVQFSVPLCHVVQLGSFFVAI